VCFCSFARRECRGVARRTFGDHHPFHPTCVRKLVAHVARPWSSGPRLRGAGVWSLHRSVCGPFTVRSSFSPGLALFSLLKLRAVGLLGVGRIVLEGFHPPRKQRFIPRHAPVLYRERRKLEN